MLLAEFVKLKRSATWLIALILPTLTVVTGTLNFARNTEQLGVNWDSYLAQVVLFYGLIFYSIGIALLASTSWRPEHRGTNWNLVMTATRNPRSLVIAKIASLVAPVAFMQVVLVVGALIGGRLVLHLPGGVPWQFGLVGAISVVVALPLIACQSMLSMLMKSFAAPVALCLIGCVIGMASIMSTGLRPLAYVWPQALVTRSLQLAGSAVSGSDGLTWDTTLPMIVTSVLLAGLFAELTAVLIRRVKLA